MRQPVGEQGGPVDPFSSPIGALPRVMARSGTNYSFGYLVDKLAARQFSTGVTTVGVPGVGKSTALACLRADLVARGCLTVFLRVRPNQPIEPYLDAAIREGLHTLTGKRERRHPFRGMTLRANAKVPFTPIEVELARDAQLERQLDVRNRLMALVSNVAGRGVPVALLVDEADSLGESDNEKYFVDALGTAAAANLPMTMVKARTSAIGNSHLWGSSFLVDLEEPHRMAPLNPRDAYWLIVETARSAGADWASVNLNAAVDATRGIPRHIHILGSRVFYLARFMPLQQAVDEATRLLWERLGARRQSLSALAHESLQALEARGRPLGVWDAKSHLAQTTSAAGPDDVVSAIKELEMAGLVVLADGDLSLA
jgi:hypothetical protein